VAFFLCAVCSNTLHTKGKNWFWARLNCERL